MNLTQRQTDILKHMLDANGPVQSADIADELGISTRTVQRELPAIADEVKSYGIILIRNRKSGSYLSGTPTSKEMLLTEMPGTGGVDPTDVNARRRYLLFNLLREREPRKIFYYSNILKVSETTVGADIAALGEWLSQNNLSVIKKPGYGVVLSGREKDYREAMRRFINENLENAAGGIGYSDEVLSNVLMNSTDGGIYSFLEKDTIERVDAVLKVMDEPKLSSLAEQAYAGLVTHIAIVIERIRQGGFIDVAAESMRSYRDLEDYDLALKILDEMGEEFEIIIPEEEVSYILLHLQGSKLAYSSEAEEDEVSVGDEALLDIIDGMIDIYNEKLAPQLKSDEEFVRGLMVHLRPVFVRLRGGMNIYNPLLDQIKDEYSGIFERCREASKLIEDATNAKVTDEEIGFLAMHFGAAEEKALSNVRNSRRVDIGIVCASGFGVARLMMAKLEKSLGSKANLRAYGKDELDDEVISQTDFFVTTLNLDGVGVDYIKVNPLVAAGDLVAIEHKLSDYSYVQRNREEGDFFSVLSGIECVSGDIRKIISNYCRYQIDSEVTFSQMLLFFGLKVCGNAAKAKMVVDDITERERMNTQLFPEMGFGLLHCRTAAVDDVVFVAGVPEDKETFSDEYFKGVKCVVLMLAPKDVHRREHANVLGAISGKFVEESTFISCIQSGKDNEVRRILTETLKDYFEKFMRDSGY